MDRDTGGAEGREERKTMRMKPLALTVQDGPEVRPGD